MIFITTHFRRVLIVFHAFLTLEQINFPPSGWVLPEICMDSRFGIRGFRPRPLNTPHENKYWIPFKQTFHPT
jgi:hypothetical protein